MVEDLQLFGHFRNEPFQPVHLIRQFLVLALPIAIRDQSLNGAARKIRHASRARLLADADELPEFILRYSEVD
jgi:hypothetical protein